ncbi:hypothetical protein FB451DRAFT_1235954 [Mycena latifolia]|nr:hypothetical protein FB451DRAFT_1235954 [Mycena latifolia]
MRPGVHGKRRRRGALLLPLLPLLHILLLRLRRRQKARRCGQRRQGLPLGVSLVRHQRRPLLSWSWSSSEFLNQQSNNAIDACEWEEDERNKERHPI